MAKCLFVFNPDCELAIANGGRFYMPSANIVKMADDLAFLPAWVGGKGDCVLVRSMPDLYFQESVCKPLQLDCIAVCEEELGSMDGFSGVPWGNSPKMCHWLSEKGLGKEWEAEQKEWYSRKMARRALQKLMEMMPDLEADILPQICYSLEEIEKKICESRYLAKAPWSSSGKGLLFLENQLGRKENEWLGGILRRQGYLMLEKQLNKVKDFAMEFHCGEEGMKFIGWSFFNVGDRGEYKGNYVARQERLQQILAEQINEQLIISILETLPGVLCELFPSYRGFLGVDMMTYRNSAGDFCLQPCVEINLRLNMGIVALSLGQHYVAKEKEGLFEICFYPDQGQALDEYLRLREEYPPVYENNRLLSGYLNLTPVNKDTHFIASVTI